MKKTKPPGNAGRAKDGSVPLPSPAAICDNPLLDPSEVTSDLHSALKRYWGYDSFRPMQERIVQTHTGTME